MKVKINDRFYYSFDAVTINYKLDSVASAFSFKARFNPDNQFHKEIFKPLQYQKVEIFDNEDNLKLTGNILNTSLSSGSSRELQTISGYSKSGIIEDVNIPFSAYPLEKNNVSLNDIVRDVLSPFNINYSVSADVLNDMNLNYARTTASPTESIKGFLSKLASQRNIIISHDSQGNLYFFRPNVNSKPKFYLTDQNTLKMNLAVNGQAMHSQIDVIRQPSKNNSGVSTVDSAINSLVNANRPIVKILTSGTDTDTKKAADNIMANELRGISLTVVINNVIDINCGDIVEVLNKEVYIYERTKFMVSGITHSETITGDNMVLQLVLPETFSGGVAQIMF